MIASDLDGAITRTEEPGRSFGGTIGIRPSCRIRTGQASEFDAITRVGRAARSCGYCGPVRLATGNVNSAKQPGPPLPPRPPHRQPPPVRPPGPQPAPDTFPALACDPPDPPPSA